MPFGRAGHVFVEARERVGVSKGGRIETQQGANTLAVCVIVVAKLEDLAVQLPEAAVFFRIVPGQLFKMPKGLLDQHLTDLAQYHVFLQRLARDVEGQVFRVHHALHEGQIFRHKFLVAVLYQHTAGVEIKTPVFTVGSKKVLSRIGREQQGIELHGRIHRKVQGVQRFLGVVGQSLIEGIVLLLGDRKLGFAPEGRLGVDPFAVHQHGKRHKGRMLANNGFNAEFFRKFGGIVLEPGLDNRAALRGVARGGLNGKRAKTVAYPHAGLGVVAKGGARGNLNLAGHHENGIEAHAKTANNVGRVGGFGFCSLFARCGFGGRVCTPGDVFCGHICQKLFGTRPGYGAQVFGQLFCCHAHACIGNGQHLGVLVQADADFKRKIRQTGGFTPVHAIAQFIQRVRCVGNKFPQKNFAISIE